MNLLVKRALVFTTLEVTDLYSFVKKRNLQLQIHISMLETSEYKDINREIRKKFTTKQKKNI